MAKIFDAVKRHYYSLEEKWYGLLDKIDSKIPVYGVVDQIDKVVPSFILFLALLSALVIGGAWLFLNPGEQGYSFRVVDEESNPIAGISVEFISGDFRETIATDEFGQITLFIPGIKAIVNVDSGGFEPFSREIIIKDKEVNDIVLKKLALLSEKKFVTLLDDKGQILSQPAIIAFSCTIGQLGSTPQSLRVENGSEFFVNVDKACTELAATVSSEGFEETQAILSATSNQIRLEKQKILLSPASLVITVKDTESKEGVPQITVRLVSVNPSEREVDQGRTNQLGEYAFEAISGRYKIVADDLSGGVYKRGQTEEFDVEGNEVKRVELLLERNQSQKNRLLLKIVDEDSGEAIANAGVQVFDGNTMREKKSTGADGGATFLNLEEDKKYSIVIVHSAYVLGIFTGLEPVDEFSGQQTSLSLKKADSTNSGTIKVSVVADNAPLLAAKVFLKNNLYDFVILDGVTDTNGSKFFPNIPSGTYSAFTETTTQTGQSPQASLLDGTTLELRIELFLKQGFLKAKVFDKQGVIIQNASVKITNALTGEVLKETNSGVSGETEKISLPYNRAVQVKVFSDGFLPFFSRKIILSPNSTKSIDVSLYRDSELQGFDVIFQRVLDGEEKNAASSMQKDKAYFLEFNLVVPGNDTQGIEAVVRTGLESEASEADSNFVIHEIVRPSASAGTVFSSCFNPSNDFDSCSPVNGPAKQVKLLFPALERGAYEFLVKVFVKQTAMPQEKLEARFAAKTSGPGPALRKPQTGAYLKQFILGEPILCDKGPPTCPNFGFLFNLSDQSGLHFTGKKNLSQGSSQDLLVGVNYAFEYVIFNQAKPRKTFSNVSLGFSATPSDNGALEFSPNSSAIISLFEPDTSFSGPPLSIRGALPSPAIEFKTQLGLTEQGSSASVFFNVLPKNVLEVEVNPKEIPFGVYNYLAVNIKDKKDNKPVKSVTLKVSKTNDFALPLISLSSDSNDGMHFLEIPPLESDSNIFVLVQAFNYQDSNVQKVSVVKTLPQFDLSEQPVDCLAIGGAPSGELNEISLVYGQRTNFFVETRNCQEPVEVYIFQRAASDPLTLENMSTLSAITDGVSPSFTLSENQKIELRLSGDKLLGEYALFVQAKFVSDREFKDKKRISVFVLPPQTGEQSCYSLSKTTFGILPRDGGIMSNNCTVFLADAFYPGISLSTENAVLDSSNTKIFPNTEFLSTSRIYGSLNKIGEDFRTETVSVAAPDTAPLQVDEEKVVGDSILQAILQIAAMCGSGGGMCAMAMKNPAILILIVISLVDQFYSDQLGEQENATCEQCLSSNSVHDDLLLGTQVEKVEITDILFNDGGWLKVHDKFIGIPETGPTPQTGNNSASSQQQARPTGGITFPTGLQLLPGGSSSGGQGLGGGSPLSALQGIGGAGGGAGGPFQMILQLIMSIFGGGQQDQRQDSCGGHKIESSDCSSLNSGSVSVQGIDLDISAISCTEIGVPKDVTQNFTNGSNPVDLFVCNKINDGKAEVTFKIQDSVDFSNEKTYSFVPEKDKLPELDVLHPKISTYFTQAGPNANLAMSFTDDSQSVETFFDGKKIKGYFIGNGTFSTENPFEILNTSLSGEEFAVLTIETYTGETTTPQLDLVYIIDSSESMQNEWQSFCSKKTALDSELLARNTSLSSKVYSLGEQKDCAQGVAQWGDETPPGPENNLSEAWGPALEDIARSHNWRLGAKRIALVFTDTIASGKDQNSPEVEPQSQSGTDELESLIEGIMGERAAPAGILSNAVQALVDNNVSVGFVFGAPLQDSKALQEFDQALASVRGFTKSYQEEGDEKILSDFILKSSFEVKRQQFHVRLVGGQEQLCRGPNDKIGVTGENALPKVLLSWDWESISEGTCDQTSGQGKIFYCDAVQFTKEIVKKLVKIKQLSSEKKFGEINSFTSFKSFLIKDNYNAGFFSDFDEFVRTKEFLPLADYVNDWNKYVPDNSRFRVTINGSNETLLPSTGLYQVNLRFSFENQVNWIFFTETNQRPSAVITIDLKPLEELDSQNPFYSMPFDGLVGIKDNSFERKGYGVGFSGEQIHLLPQTASSTGLTTYPVTGQSAVNVNVSQVDSLDYVNRQNPGVLLSIQKNNSLFDLVFSPNNATPVMLEASSQNGHAKAFYSLTDGASPVSSSGYLNTWTGAASSILECKDFEGNDLPKERQDSKATQGTSCQLKAGALAENSFGFAWNAPQEGKIFLKTVFYTPSDNYAITNSCQNDSLIITPQASSAQNPLALNFTGTVSGLDMAGLFELVKNEKVCIGEEENKVSFWWNKKYLYDELQASANNYFNEIRTTEENLKECVVG